jgi:ABC-2 type transport system ATP-binding protein
VQEPDPDGLRRVTPPVTSLVLDSVSLNRGGAEVLRSISLKFDGGVLAVLGPNGAGKSSLLSLLATVLVPTSGRITLGEDSLTTGRGVRNSRSITGYQEQIPLYRGGFRVEEAVRYAGWLKKIERGDLRAATISALSRCHLIGLKDSRITRLSGGETKRLAIAQALVHSPSLLILDEPTASLDPLERNDLLVLLKDISADVDIIFSTHITSDVSKIASQVLVVAEGRSRFFGSLAEFTGPGRNSEEAVDQAYGRYVRGAGVAEG